MLNAWNRPVLESITPVVEECLDVRIDHDAIRRVARWLAHEPLPVPGGAGLGPFALPDDPDLIIDAVLFTNSLNFAFTDFITSVKFERRYQGTLWSDSEAMFAGIHAAIEEGLPILTGAWMAEATRDDLARLFTGTIEMPMLDERVTILNQIGERLVAEHGGRFSNFVRSCAPRPYADGDGLLERLIAEFPRFDDSSPWNGRTVQFHKLAQLGLWGLHTTLAATGTFILDGLEDLTAFADYIVPVALEVMGIFEYSDDLRTEIEAGVEIPVHSRREVELRACTLWATALLTEEVNRIRPHDLQVVIPQVDYRLWTAYHATFRPHHLTRTVMY